MVTLDRFQNSDKSIRFSVQDSGIGIPPENDFKKYFLIQFTQADASMSRRFWRHWIRHQYLQKNRLEQLMGGKLHG